MFRILVIEDDAHTRRLMQAVLKVNGYLALPAEDGVAALEVMDTEHVDLILLDLMMPRMDGFEFASQVRQSGSNIPILMVTAKQMPEDKKKGFLVGTDDYMTKPVDEEEMLLRIKALLRRSQIVNDHVLRIGEVVLDYNALTVQRGSEKTLLPQKEFYLLFKLLSWPDVIFTRQQLMDEIWGMETDSLDSTVNVHIHRLRSRFEQYPEFEIATIRGLGYKAVKRC